MCRFCEKAGLTIKKITVLKYEENRPKYDGIFGRVELGRTITQRQPCAKIETDRGYYTMQLPVEFIYCPRCGRKIKEEK